MLFVDTNFINLTGLVVAGVGFLGFVVGTHVHLQLASLYNFMSCTSKRCGTLNTPPTGI